MKWAYQLCWWPSFTALLRAWRSTSVLLCEADGSRRQEGTTNMTDRKKAMSKKPPPIKVYCRSEDRAVLRDKARSTGMSQSKYLLQVGLGYPVRSIVDHQQVEELFRINGDLGRLGGLLKLWLSEDTRVAGVGVTTIRTVLKRIEHTQGLMVHIIRQIVQPKAKPIF